MELRRCQWAGDDPLYIAYHDTEWGKPLHDDDKLFELLILEGMQAGLSWITILRKREAFRAAFDGFDPQKAARWTEEKVEELMGNPAIVRNRRKILATVENARGFLKIQEEFGSFDAFLWRYVDGVPIVNHWERQEDMPASTPLSCRISQDLKRRGFRFVGPTIVYSFLQAAGLVDDHMVWCPEHTDCRGRGTGDSR